MIRLGHNVTQETIILGLDPGLRHTGWGVVGVAGNRLRYIAAGTFDPPAALPMAARLAQLAEGLRQVIAAHRPDEAAVEETFVNGNARAALKLGQARGIALLVPAERGLPVAEYAANLIKKSVTGYGHADKGQIQAMMKLLLGGYDTALKADAADALAVAVCHAHHRDRIPVIPAQAGIQALPRGGGNGNLMPRRRAALDSRLRGNDDIVEDKQTALLFKKTTGKRAVRA